MAELMASLPQRHVKSRKIVLRYLRKKKKIPFSSKYFITPYLLNKHILKHTKFNIKMRKKHCNLQNFLLFLLSHKVMSNSASLWTAACQNSLSLTISQSLPKFMSIASVIPSSHLIFSCPLPLRSSIFPIIRDFPVIWLFARCDQNTGASASTSVLPVSIQG